ncbi:MAG: heavy-metal-associated domain-containing protein [Limnohabitans sp.]|jgi:copper chaperone CopZ|nr:heavy-metal-associated domain-containing protein [Limnohabitans sp.]
MAPSAVARRDFASLACASLVTFMALCAAGCASTVSTTSTDRISSDINLQSAQLGAVHDAQTLAPGRYALVVFGMSCPKCISNVDLQLGRIDGIANPKVDMKHGIVTIDVDGPVAPSREAVFRAILDAGFTLREIRKLPEGEVQP